MRRVIFCLFLGGCVGGGLHHDRFQLVRFADPVVVGRLHPAFARGNHGQRDSRVHGLLDGGAVGYLVLGDVDYPDVAVGRHQLFKAGPGCENVGVVDDFDAQVSAAVVGLDQVDDVLFVGLVFGSDEHCHGIVILHFSLFIF